MKLMNMTLIDLLPFDFAAMAKEAYRAYGATTGFKNFRGDPMPEWADLGDKIQAAWLAATREVSRLTIEGVIKFS